MGRAQVAAGDIGAAFINPANLMDFETFNATSMYSNLAEDIAYTMVGTAFPLKEGAYGVIGVGYLGAQTGSIYTASGEVRSGILSTVDYSNRLLIVNYGREISSFLRAGAALKFFTRAFGSLQGGSATGNDLDLGLIFYPRDNFSAGLTLQNILPTQLAWTNGTKEDMPTNVKMGVNYSPRKDWVLLADYDASRDTHFGVEWLPKEFIALRGGMEIVPTGSKDTVTNYSMGVGLNFKGFKFDYAYYADTLLAVNSSSFFSLSYALPLKTVESNPIMPAQKSKGLYTSSL